MSPAKAPRKVALYDSPGDLDIKRAQAALWLLREIDEGQIGVAVEDPDEVEHWCRSICNDAISSSLAAAERKIADAMRQHAAAATRKAAEVLG